MCALDTVINLLDFMKSLIIVIHFCKPSSKDHEEKVEDSQKHTSTRRCTSNRCHTCDFYAAQLYLDASTSGK